MKRHDVFRRCGSILTAFLLASGIFGVPALKASAREGDEKAYVLTVQDGLGLTLPTPEEPAFWEYPTLPAGQQRVGGVLRLANTGTLPVDLTLQEIELPYGDEEALAYLNHLRIVVAERKEATASAEEVAAPLSTTAPGETEPLPAEPSDAAPEDGGEPAADDPVQTDAAGTDQPTDPASDDPAPQETTAAAQPWTQGETVLYDGPYSRIAEEGGLKLSVENLQPGEVREYTVSLYCDFTYEGDPSITAQQVYWRFQASSTYTVAPEAPSPWDNPVLPIVLGTAGGLLVLAVATAAVRSLVRRRRGKRDSRLPGSEKQR